MLPELAHRAIEDVLWIELPRSRHGRDNSRTITQERPLIAGFPPDAPQPLVLPPQDGRFRSEIGRTLKPATDRKLRRTLRTIPSTRKVTA
jgi:hypothetical protein